jgi:hypothetical protein
MTTSDRITMSDRLQQYEDGLITFTEMLHSFSQIRNHNGKLPNMSHKIEITDELKEVFTDIGIAGLIARIQATQKIDPDSSYWHLNEKGDKILCGIFLDENDVEHHPDDYSWQLSKIEFSMPEGSIIGTSLAPKHQMIALYRDKTLGDRLRFYPE